MASIAVMIIGAIVSATAFTGAGVLAKHLDPTSSNLEKERKRHDLAQEKFTKDHSAWSEHRSEMYDFIQKQHLNQNVAQTDFQITDENLEMYKDYHPDVVIDTVEEPVFSSYYQPSDEIKHYQYLYIIGATGLSVYLIKKIV